MRNHGTCGLAVEPPDPAEVCLLSHSNNWNLNMMDNNVKSENISTVFPFPHISKYRNSDSLSSISLFYINCHCKLMTPLQPTMRHRVHVHGDDKFH